MSLFYKKLNFIIEKCFAIGKFNFHTFVFYEKHFFHFVFHVSILRDFVSILFLTHRVYIKSENNQDII